MCRRRRGGGRVRGEQPVGLVDGVGGVSLRVHAAARGSIGRVRPLRRLPFRLSAHPESVLSHVLYTAAVARLL